MGYLKQKMIEEDCRAAEALDRKLKGYEKKIEMEEGKVSMYCPSCGYAWSKRDMQEKVCVHGCGYKLLFNIDD